MHEKAARAIHRAWARVTGDTTDWDDLTTGQRVAFREQGFEAVQAVQTAIEAAALRTEADNIRRAWDEALSTRQKSKMLYAINYLNAAADAKTDG